MYSIANLIHDFSESSCWVQDLKAINEGLLFEPIGEGE
ncbi:hypothetical protein M948_03125 [Virgibacillus sp. CM-4]|uniref:Uncharacterized protein n=1 Tax=Virgibacillus massiliensis TaxID=1462526 RepID=A0A024Q8T6_9BACI|nr:hypothetical protein M948_03125 [Virgibacillus sp. CM-4]CDQ38928.1 hypothetical protein BN990_01207 [Virgibacillus massiliensis]